MTDVPTQEKKILPILLPSMVEAENFSDHARMYEEDAYLWYYGVSMQVGLVTVLTSRHCQLPFVLIHPLSSQCYFCCCTTTFAQPPFLLLAVYTYSTCSNCRGHLLPTSYCLYFCVIRNRLFESFSNQVKLNCINISCCIYFFKNKTVYRALYANPSGRAV